MAYFQGVIRSKSLDMDTGLCVLLPYDQVEEGAPPSKVLYLLHGLRGSCSSWTRETRVESYIKGKNIAVVMPEVQRSFYMDMDMGLKYFTYVTEELPVLCKSMFRLSDQREDTFVAGLSMGGYGAFKCALNRPDLYSACASFSGATDLREIIDLHGNDGFKAEMQSALGLDMKLEDGDDLFHLAKNLLSLPQEDRPRMFITCGQQDTLYSMNIRYKNHLQDLGLDLEYMEWPGDHEWTFWDKSIQRAIGFFLK